MEANTLKRFNYCDQFTQAHGISIKTLMKKKKKCLIDIFFFRSDPNLSSFQTIRNIFIHFFYRSIHYETVSICNVINTRYFSTFFHHLLINSFCPKLHLFILKNYLLHLGSLPQNKKQMIPCVYRQFCHILLN